MLKLAKRAAPIAAVLALGALWYTARPSTQTMFPSTKNGDWVAYTADNRGTDGKSGRGARTTARMRER